MQFHNLVDFQTFGFGQRVNQICSLPPSVNYEAFYRASRKAYGVAVVLTPALQATPHY